ncbi:hypothetical protein Ga0466249_005428 [Sporomusaceae bacterium BoRhaA]|nr:hypothetical protein [Pelorhabdus rhamnosifermentans]
MNTNTEPTAAYRRPKTGGGCGWKTTTGLRRVTKS